MPGWSRRLRTKRPAGVSKRASFVASAIVAALLAAPVIGGSPAQAAPNIDASGIKAQIEAATSDITINLDPGVYEFNVAGGAAAQINNTLAIKVTLVGAVDAAGNPATQFVMGSAVTGAPRFVRADKGTIDISNVQVTGNAGQSGGISARNVVAANSIFENNYTNDGVSGGGAIRVTGGTLDVEKSKFFKNSVGATSDGGAISSEYSGNVRINNSIFDGNKRSGNTNQYGGAISVKQPGVADTTVSITNSIFTNNELTAAGNLSTGGAIRIYGTAQLKSVLIDNSLFKGNATKTAFTNNGGAVAFMTTNNSTISNSTFIDNAATKYGGAVYYENSVTNNKIVNSTFVGNTATAGGTGVTAYASGVTLDSVTLLSNTVTTQGNGSVVTLKDSIVAGTATYSSATISYTGTNLARTTSAEPAIAASDVFEAYTSSTLAKVSDSNYVAPIIVDGPASQKVAGVRVLNAGQNGIARKAPLSDIGAYEAPEYFTVSFNSNGGTAVSDQTVESGDLAALPAEPTLSDYTFGGWFTDNDTFVDGWDFANTNVVSNVTLYAKWTPVPVVKKYKVTYDLNTGTGTAPVDNNEYTDGDTVAVQPAPADATRSGFSFAGWNTAADGSGTAYVPGSSTFAITADTVLYAQWSIIPVVDQYTVTYEANTGSGALPVEAIHNDGDSVTVQAPGADLVKAGFIFAGWNTKADGSGTSYQANAKFEIHADTILFAQWTAVAPVDPDPKKKDTPLTTPTETEAAKAAALATTGTETVWYGLASGLLLAFGALAFAVSRRARKTS